MTYDKIATLKKQIISVYENDPKIKNKINLDMQSKDILDQSMENFKNEIYESLKNRYSENLAIENNIEEFESAFQEFENDTIFDLGILEKIDEKVLSIFQYLNISLFNKSELKNKIINDMLEYLFKLGNDKNIKNKIISRIPGSFLRNEIKSKLEKINGLYLKKYFIYCYPKRKNNKERILNNAINEEENIKLWYIINSIPWYIENHIDHEFKEYELKKRQIQKELLKELIIQILPELNSFFESHKKKRLKKINIYQIKNFKKFIMEFIDAKYIQADKKNKKLNNEDYLFLKSKINRFINERYSTAFLKNISYL